MRVALARRRPLVVAPLLRQAALRPVLVHERVEAGVGREPGVRKLRGEGGEAVTFAAVHLGVYHRQALVLEQVEAPHDHPVGLARHGRRVAPKRQRKALHDVNRLGGRHVFGFDAVTKTTTFKHVKSARGCTQSVHHGAGPHRNNARSNQPRCSLTVSAVFNESNTNNTTKQHG